MWTASIGFFVVSTSMLVASHMIRRSDAIVELAFNRTFHEGVRTDEQLQPAPSTTENTKSTERRLRTGFSRTVIRRDVARTTSRRHRRHKRRNETVVDGGGVRRRRHDAKSPLGRQLCQMYDLYIDVERLGWSDTVLYPRRFNIRYCAGRCPLVVRAHDLDASNHAVLRAIAGGRRRRQLAPPSPCCVATKLRPMNLLYRDKLRGQFDIWKLNDVVADTCGCR